MKKIFAILFGLTLLWSCNPLEDTYKQLDDAQEPYKESIEYTLVDADYITASEAALNDASNADDSVLAKSIKTNMAFNSRFPGKDYIPAVLANNFPALSKGSSAMVTYKEYSDLPSFFSDLSSIYRLTTNDYKTLWNSNNLYVEAFTPTVNADDYLPGLLDEIFPNDVNGTYRFLAYNYSNQEPDTIGGLLPIVTYDFQEGTASDSIGNNWINVYTSGSKPWVYKLYSGNLYAQFSSYNSGEQNEAWLIRKFDQLDTIENPTFSFLVKAGYYNADCLSIMLSEDFDGQVDNVSTATWQDISSNFNIPQEPSSGYGNFVESGNFDLSAYKGKTIYIAFKYVGDGTDNSATTTYQIDNVTVSNNATVLSIDASEVQYTVYTKNGNSWEMATNIHTLSVADYQEMGFSKDYISTDDAQTYLPMYLAQKFPYALDGDVKNVAFRTSNSDMASVIQFTKTDGEWTSNDFLSTNTDQFFNDGTKWFYDPTVHFTPVSADYQLLVDWVYQNLKREYGSSYGNDEFYYGASAYYSNWDLRLSKRTQYNIPGFETGTEAEQIALTWQRLEEGAAKLLLLKFPNAISEVSGFPVYYWIYLPVYKNDLTKFTYVGIFQLQSGEFKRVTTAEDAAVSQGKLTQDQVNWNRSN